MGLRIAQLGRGRWGRRLLDAWDDVAGAEVVAVADPAGGDGVIDEEQLWRRDDVDALVIASPPSCHGEQARRGLEKGWHVFVEKPLTMDGGGPGLLELAAQRRRVLMVGHLLLYCDAATRVESWLREGRLGSLRRATFRRWGRGGAGRAVDALWNLAPHDLALADRWLGPLEVTGSRAWSTEGQACDEAWLELKGDDVPVELHVGHGLAPAPRGARRRAVLEGTEATAVLEGERVSLHRGGAVVEAHVRRLDPLRAELADFVRCTSGATPRADAASGVRVVRLMHDAMTARQRMVRAG